MIETTTANDTITATSATLGATDRVIDSSTTDFDTMDITLTAAMAGTTTITKVEKVNFNLDMFDGSAAATVNATNITGAEITVSSAKLGFNGEAGVTGAGANTIVAGSKITDLAVIGLTEGTVNAGAADVVAMTGTTGRANTLIVNGDVSVTNTTSTLTTINATADSVVTYDTTVANAATVTGSSDVTLKMAVADVVAGASVTNSMTSGALNLTLTDAGTADATNFAVDKITLAAAGANVITVANGQALEVAATATGTDLTLDTTTSLASTASVDTAVSLGTVTIGDTDMTTTVNASAALTIADLATAGSKVALAGAGDLTVTTSDGANVDASALTGDLVFTSTVATDIKGGSGDNTITLSDNNAGYTGQAGVDTLAIAALTGTNTVGAALAAGNDVVSLASGLAGILAIDAGLGTDIIKVAAGGDISGITMTDSSGFEVITLVDDLITSGAQLNGQDYTIKGTVSADRTETVTVNGATGLTTETINLSGITIDSTVGEDNGIAPTATVFINGQDAVKDTITGTSASDQIEGGTGKDVITGGAGDDFFVFADDDSLEASMAKITDYQAAAASSDNDKLVLGTTTTLTAADNVVDVATNGTAPVQAIFADAVGTVDIAFSAKGIMTLVGTSADVALADTLAEYIDIAESVLAVSGDLVAFEFGGNTYVLEDDGVVDTSTVLELTDVVDIVGISATAAADTIFVV